MARGDDFIPPDIKLLSEILLKTEKTNEILKEIKFYLTEISSDIKRLVQLTETEVSGEVNAPEEKET